MTSRFCTMVWKLLILMGDAVYCVVGICEAFVAVASVHYDGWMMAVRKLK